MNNKPKILKTYQFKTKSTDGNFSKTIFSVLENGQVNINQLFLVEDREFPHATLITSRFGKNLWCVVIGFKLSSFMKIFSGMNEALIKNGIDIDELFRKEIENDFK